MNREASLGPKLEAGRRHFTTASCVDDGRRDNPVERDQLEKDTNIDNRGKYAVDPKENDNDGAKSIVDNEEIKIISGCIVPVNDYRPGGSYLPNNKDTEINRAFPNCNSTSEMISTSSVEAVAADDKMTRLCCFRTDWLKSRNRRTNIESSVAQLNQSHDNNGKNQRNITIICINILIIFMVCQLPHGIWLAQSAYTLSSYDDGLPSLQSCYGHDQAHHTVSILRGI